MEQHQHVGCGWQPRPQKHSTLLTTLQELDSDFDPGDGVLNDSVGKGSRALHPLLKGPQGLKSNAVQLFSARKQQHPTSLAVHTPHCMPLQLIHQATQMTEEAIMLLTQLKVSATHSKACTHDEKGFAFLKL